MDLDPGCHGACMQGGLGVVAWHMLILHKIGLSHTNSLF